MKVYRVSAEVNNSRITFTIKDGERTLNSEVDVTAIKDSGDSIAFSEAIVAKVDQEIRQRSLTPLNEVEKGFMLDTIKKEIA